MACVRLLRLGVPSHRFLGDSVVLRCVFDLEGERLYSVKWYKDREEFFRYIPADRDNPITVFRLPGVRVWVSGGREGGQRAQPKKKKKEMEAQSEHARVA